MYPAIVLSDALRISTWGVMVSVAALAVLWLGRRNAPARGLDAELVEWLWPWLILGGFLGAHVYYLAAVAGWPFRALPWAQVLNAFNGTAVQGGFLGGAGAAAACLRWKRRPFLPFCDALAPAGALAQALTRLGCFAAGCCFGRPTDTFLGVTYASPWADPAVPRGIPLHPAQLYEAVLDAALAAFLQNRLRAPSPPGRLFSLYLAGAGLIRFAVEFFRGDDAERLIGGLAHSQFTALAMVAAAAALYHMIRSRERMV